MKILKNVEARKGMGRRRSEVALAIVDFVGSEDKNLKFECDNKDEARRIYQNALSFVNAHDYPLKAIKSANDIYVLRTEDM
jgi:hypothetical protein